MESLTIALPDLLLSVPVQQDAERMTEICRDSDIPRWTEMPSDYTLDSAHAFLRDLVARERADLAQGKEATWAVRELSGDGEPVLVGMVGIAVEGRLGEIGYWLDPAARGRGLMTRAVRAVVDTAFDDQGLGLTALRWRCMIHDGVPNWPSWRIAWSLGFRREGTVRALIADKGALRDGWIATLMKDDPRQPVAPWDGPVRQGSQHARSSEMPLVAHDGVGQREGDDPEALVRRFHRVYGLPIQTDGPSLERASLNMRMGLIAEEFAELAGAVYGAGARAEIESACARAVAGDDETRDTVEAADALADLIYVIYGMALETGIDLAAVLSEVQRSNMSKLGADGRPVYRHDGKVLKGPDYFPPDVAGVLRGQQGL